MNNVRTAAGASYIKKDIDSLRVSGNDMHDKIINLRFVRSSGRSFFIRSDYEAVYNKDGSIDFIKCVQKPDIKITYKQVAESVAIEVDIYITNLHIAEEMAYKAGKSVNGSYVPGDINVEEAGTDPVTRCIIQMGYRGQFRNWTDEAQIGSIEEFQNLAAMPIDGKAERPNEIDVQILTGYPQGYPPDRVMYFKGIVGTLLTGLPYKQTPSVLDKNYGDNNMPKEASYMERPFYQFITRRFLAPHVIYKIKDGEVLIYKKDSYDNKDYKQRLEVSRKLSLDAKEMNTEANWKPLATDPESGLMAVEDANRFGVVCALSDKLRALEEPMLRKFGIGENNGKEWSVPATPYTGPSYNELGGQLVSLRQHFPFIRWLVLMDGSYYVYHVAETEEDLYKDPYIKNNMKHTWLVLPAIYDMTPQGTRTIRCPFISFLSPGMTVYFQSRFTVGTFVGFFYPVKTNAFLVIIANVSFATVQKDNMMELMCVDLPKKVTYVDRETGEIRIEDEPKKVSATATGEKQAERNENIWTKQEKKVSQYFRGDKRFSRWRNIVEMVHAIAPEGTAKKTVLLALQDWNPEHKPVTEVGADGTGRLYIKYEKMGGTSIENRNNGIGVELGVKVSWLMPDDMLVIKHPFRANNSDYLDKDYKNWDEYIKIKNAEKAT